MIEIYTSHNCPLCQRAKALLQRRGLSFTELPIDGDRKRMKEMITRSTHRSLPQIFINERFIGGYQELIDYDMEGRLTAECGDE